MPMAGVLQNVQMEMILVPVFSSFFFVLFFFFVVLRVLLLLLSSGMAPVVS